MNQNTSAFLALEDVHFSYRALPAVRALHWRWEQGQQWACVGPNGAGKTTLAGLLSRQLQHGSGSITAAQELVDAGCSYVCFEQQRALCDRDARRDDSEFRSDARDPGTTVAMALGGDLAAEQAQDWIRRLGLEHILDRGLRFISTGEMRKTLLLRAILQAPALLILDSPLDGLDIESQAVMTDVIEALLDTDVRLLLLTRSLTALPAGISHLLVLDRGRVMASGPVDEVLAREDVGSLMQPPPLEFGNLPAPAHRDYVLDTSVPLLQLNDVDVSYDNTAVLKNVTWTFRRGQHCHLSGPNGCGKTTLLSLVTGDNHKAYGQDISLFGQRRGSGESIWDIKQKFGVLNTQLHLNHARGMRVAEVVVSGFFDTVGLYDDWGDKQLEIARGWLRALGLLAQAATPFDTLSFGLQRMVLLARAMVKSPLILVLDEPCLGLDIHHTGTILDAIDHIATNTDTQIIYVSHSVGEVPACINQWLAFEPSKDGFRLSCRESP